MLLTVIPPLWLISGQAWGEHLDAIYGVPAPVAAAFHIFPVSAPEVDKIISRIQS